MIKDIYPLGENPGIGIVPKYMYAQVIREHRFGEPKDAFKIEKIRVPEVGPDDVLVYVMAAGANYNNVWVALGIPVNVIENRRKIGETDDFHIGGSDASGIVWKTGTNVSNVKVGDKVVLHCGRWDKEDPHILAGKDPALSPSQHIWGYESNYGSFAQYTLVQSHQCVPKPDHLTWVDSASYMLTGATAYRMLLGWPGNKIKKGDPVLIWGGSGGLGTMAIQICKDIGALPVAVVSDDSKIKFCKDLGAVGVINRKKFDHWGMLPHWKDTYEYNKWLGGAKKFGEAFWHALGESRNPVLVIEHPGEYTIPTSMWIVDRGGMVVTCAGTTGFSASLDIRHLWMRQKRLQGSHFANDDECSKFNQMVIDNKVKPVVSTVFKFNQTDVCHQQIYKNKVQSGKMVILVNAVSKSSK